MKYLAVILVCLFYLSGVCQTTFSGVVKDGTTDAGLPGAHIYLLNDWRTGTTTGLEGEFEIELQQSHMNDSIVISFIGYQETVLAVSEVSSEIKLFPMEHQLNDIVVAATPLIAEEFQYKEIQKLEIYTNPSAKADPILAVNSLPSATTADESANISLRGGSPAETGIFFNDVPIYDAVRFSQLNGIGTFSLFNTAIVKQMSVFPGNPPLEYGNATSGIISIQTDDHVPEESGNSINLGLANIGYNRLQKAGKRSGLNVFTNYQPSELLKGVNQESLDAIKKFNMVDFGAYFFTQNEKLGTVKVFNYSINESYNFNFRSPSYQGIFSHGKIRNLTVAKLEKRINRSVFSLNQGFSYSKTDFSYSISENEIKKTDWFSGVNYQYLKEKIQLKAGFSNDFRRQDASIEYPEYSYALDTSSNFIAATFTEKVMVSEAYAYVKYFLADNWVLGGGLRKRLFAKDNFLSGQANVQFEINEHLKWITSAGVYNKKSMQENSSGIVQINSKQFSTDLHFNRNQTEVSISGFLKQNLYDEAVSNFSGVELFASTKFSDKLKGSLSATFISPDIVDAPLDLPNIHYFYRGNLDWNFLKQWTLNANMLLREGNTFVPVVNSQFDNDLGSYEPFYAESKERLPNYFNLGFSMSRIFLFNENLNMIAFISANNITNRENVRSYAYNYDYSETSPELFSRRTFYFGVVVNF